MWRGIYECPKQCRFGLLPPDPAKLIKAFLNSDDFLIISPNDRNSLGFGTTQLYNHQIVYNSKRCGRVELAGLVYEFRTKAGYPKKATVEFLREVFRRSDNHQEARMTTKTPRKPGSAKGQILYIAVDFDAPLDFGPDAEDVRQTDELLDRIKRGKVGICTLDEAEAHQHQTGVDQVQTEEDIEEGNQDAKNSPGI